MRRLATAVAFLLLLRFGDPGAAPPREPLTLCIVVDVTASMAPMGAQVIGRGSAAGVVSPEESVAQVAAAVAAVSELLEPGDRVCVGRIARAVAFSPGLVPPGSVRQAEAGASPLASAGSQRSFWAPVPWRRTELATSEFATDTTEATTQSTRASSSQITP